MYAHAMIHSHDVQEPKSRMHSIAHKGKTYRTKVKNYMSKK